MSAEHTATISPSSRTYRVFLGDELLLETDQVLELQERYGERTYPVVAYVARAAAKGLDLVPSEHRTHCPLKGDASYFGLRGIDNAVWSYEQPKDAVASIGGYLGFDTSKGFRIEPA
jgi:uncharacterized protein (DUF427 family)